MSRIVLHIPHSSTKIPHAYRPLFYLDDAALRAELLAMTDLYTDDLFALPFPAAVMPVSRLLCDAERFREPERECMTEKGMWVCYTRTAAGSPLKHVTDTHRREILQKYYDPHHALLTRLTADALAAEGQALIVDCHSFPSRALPYEDASAERPDICIGCDAFHTPETIVCACAAALTEMGYTTAINSPFSGTIIPMTYYGIEPRVQGLMLEINRRLYMNEATGEKSAGYASLKRDLAQLVFYLESLL